MSPFSTAKDGNSVNGKVNPSSSSLCFTLADFRQLSHNSEPGSGKMDREGG